MLMTARFLLLTSLVHALASGARAQPLELQISKPFDNKYNPTPIGVRNGSFFSREFTGYDLDHGTIGGVIEGWTLATLEQEFRTTLELPTQGLPWFVVQSVVLTDAGFRAFYSYGDDRKHWAALASVPLDAQGKVAGEAMDVIRVEDKAWKGHRFSVWSDAHNGNTVAMLQYPAFDHLEPEMRVVTVSSEGAVLLDKTVTLGSAKQWRIDCVTTDARGNVYIGATCDVNAREGPCDRPIFILHEASGELKTYCPDRTDDLANRKFNDEIRIFHGPGKTMRMLHPVFDDAKLVANMLGFRVASFDTEAGTLLSDRFVPLGRSYPPEKEAGKDGLHSWKNVQIISCSAQEDGSIQVLGAAFGTAMENMKAMVSYTFHEEDPECLMSVCSWERKFWYTAALYNPQAQFWSATIRGTPYLFSNEKQENIGKRCGDLEDWNGISLECKRTKPVFGQADELAQYTPTPLPLDVGDRLVPYTVPFILGEWCAAVGQRTVQVTVHHGQVGAPAGSRQAWAGVLQHCLPEQDPSYDLTCCAFFSHSS